MSDGKHPEPMTHVRLDEIERMSNRAASYSTALRRELLAEVYRLRSVEKVLRADNAALRESLADALSRIAEYRKLAGGGDQ